MNEQHPRMYHKALQEPPPTRSAPVRRLRCKECYWVGDDSMTLRAANPFEASDIITGCPRCHQPNPFEMLCEVPGCPELSSMGTPTAAGYRFTCHKHRPDKD